MKTIKSEQNIKISLNKYQNFFTEKNWKDAMYMDDRAAQKPDLDTRMKNTSSIANQPRTKLSLSLTEKAGAVLSDPRKMGMLEKVKNQKTRKSMAKISYTSTLPPIKTQTLQTSEYLNKLKNQINEFSLKSIQLQKQTSQIRASINQSRQRIIAFKQQLNMKKQKQQKQIAHLTQTTTQNKYIFEVRSNMVENLKTDIRALTKRNNNLQSKLKTLKTELHSASVQLDNNRKSLNNNIYNKKLYETRQQFYGEEFRYQSIAAQKKYKHEKQAERIHQKLENVQKYGQDQYKYQTNLQNHFKTLNQLRVQQVISGIINSLFNKSQAEWQEYERSYNLMKMHSLINNSQKKDHANNNESFTQNKSMSSNWNKSIINPVQPDSQINVVQLYHQSFEVKQELTKKIKEKEILQSQLQKKKEVLYKKWIAKTFEDPFIDANKKLDFSKQIKQLYQKQQRLQRNKKIEEEFKIWERKQQERLGLKLSKKIIVQERFSKILQYLIIEGKKLQHTEQTDSQKIQQKDKQMIKDKTKVPSKETILKKSTKNSWA